MLSKLTAISKNTFVESIRQPIYAIIIIIGLILLILSPSLTMYTIDDDNKLLREIGLSTIFLCGLFISIFTACGAITEEIESKTVTTVLSKPVKRGIFILGKIVGIFGAVFMAHILLTMFHMFAIRHGVMETASDTNDWTVIGLAGGAILISIVISTFMNYFYDWKFTSTWVVLLTICSAVAMTILAFIDKQWKFNPSDNHFSTFDIYASLLLLQAVLVLVVLAVMFSTRFNVVITLSSCICVFLLGLVNDHFFGKAAETELWAKILRVVIPNFQIFWISDAIYEGSSVPASYLLITSSYAVFYIAAIVFLSFALFHKRQVG